jgi:hypothetical protein
MRSSTKKDDYLAVQRLKTLVDQYYNPNTPITSVGELDRRTSRRQTRSTASNNKYIIVDYYIDKDYQNVLKSFSLSDSSNLSLDNSNIQSFLDTHYKPLVANVVSFLLKCTCVNLPDTTPYYISDLINIPVYPRYTAIFQCDTFNSMDVTLNTEFVNRDYSRTRLYQSVSSAVYNNAPVYIHLHLGTSDKLSASSYDMFCLFKFNTIVAKYRDDV